MSTLMTQARNRVPRFADAAVQRARLSVVPSGPSNAPRAPFVVLVFATLIAGVVGLLMFNTQMQQSSFYATSLQGKADDLVAKQQSLDMELEQLRDPQRLAQAARQLGMVPPAEPAFVQLSTGQILGSPMPASPDDAVRINPLPAELPANLNPAPRIVNAPATPSASPKTATVAGKKKADASRTPTRSAQGATR